MSITTAPTYEHIVETHDKFLYPITRVVAAANGRVAGGSGVVVYSKPEAEGSSRYESYVLTNHHVIAGLIDISEKWNSAAGRNLKIETRSEAAVEFFTRENLSRITDETAKRAEVVAWDEQRDLALLRLRASIPVEAVAPIIQPTDFDEKVFISSPIYTVGCGMGVPPLITSGHVGGFDFIIDNFPYTLTTAPSIFGNSGGACMLQETGEVIGITARIAVVFIGFGGSAVTHMSWSIAPQSIYTFLEEQKYDFIVDPTVDPRQRERERAELRRKALEAQIAGPPTGEAEARKAEDIGILPHG